MRARGEPIPYPVEIRQQGRPLARYYFADDFKIVEARGVKGVSYFLVHKDDPKVRPRALRRRAPRR